MTRPILNGPKITLPFRETIAADTIGAICISLFHILRRLLHDYLCTRIPMAILLHADVTSKLPCFLKVKYIYCTLLYFSSPMVLWFPCHHQ